MKVKDIKLSEIEFNSETEFSYAVEGNTEKLIEYVNKKRAEKGYTDLVGGDVIDYDNDVYYTFGLFFNFLEPMEFMLYTICNHGEKDDFVEYVISLTPKEKEMLLMKVIEQLARDLYRV